LVIEEKRVREREKEKRKGRKRKKIRKKEVQTADGRVRVFPADSNCASRSVSAGRAGSKNPTVSSDFLLLVFFLFLIAALNHLKIPGNKNKLTLSSVIHFHPPKCIQLNSFSV
jgi:hypothetical protein